MKKRWLVKIEDPGVAARLAGELGVSPLTAKALAARGLADPAAARAFLSPALSGLPDPLTLPGMAEAARLLAEAVRTGRTIWVYTDFDADGVTSAALLLSVLEAFGSAARPWLPRRDKEGYGLHVEPLEEIAREGGGLVVTADCGITAVEPARAARRLGLTLIVTDHHTPGPELPEADALVDPKLPGSAYPDSMIAGVGVAWNLLAAVRRVLREEGWFSDARPEPDLKEWLDLVALGTVSDLVPLTDVNRAFVRAGIMQMNRNPRPGVAALAQAAGLSGELKAGHLAFQLGPRINAAGRMEGPQEAVSLLLAPTVEEARPLASLLDNLNRARRAEEAETVRVAVETIRRRGYHPNAWSLVVEGEGFHPGVVGIAASRLVDRFHRAAVVLAVEGDTAKGSARAVPGLDLYDALTACAAHLVRFGGHHAAAGLTIAREKIPAFREAFEAAVRERIGEEDLLPLLRADGDAEIGEFTLAAVQELGLLEPFGAGNPTPVYRVRGLKIEDLRPFGENGRHLRLKLGDTAPGPLLEAVAWDKGGEFDGLRAGARVDVLVAARVRAWNDRAYVQLTLEDLRPAQG